MGRAKDWMLEKTVPGILNQTVLKRYGRVTHFKIDSDQRTAEFELMLEGEVQPLRVGIPRFDLINDNGETSIVIHELQTSRQWLTQLAQDQVIGKPFKLPASAAKYAEMLL